MNLISYAQNYEDIMLWRALKDVENGFYIDVGAAWPDVHSITRLFYERGWHGINIEPNHIHIDRYIKERTNDINLPIAISDQAGEAEMFFISNTGLSSLNQEIAESHGKLGWETSSSIVKLSTLASICDKYCLDKEIHFLKIDIEGFEKQALQGNDWARFRPWVIVIEATLPMSQVENYKDWESILLDAKYSFAYADGLNRFYVSEEHKELLPAFKYPPNVFDEFKLIITEQAEAKASQAEAKVSQAEAKASQAEAKAEQIHTELQGVYSSRSWRITAPLRWLIHQTRSQRQPRLYMRTKAFLKRMARRTLSRSIMFINSSPNLRIRVIKTTHTLGLYSILRRVYFQFSGAPAQQKETLNNVLYNANTSKLTPQARSIYANLQARIAAQQKGRH